MDKEKIIEKYKNIEQVQMHVLQDGRVVIGEEVDEENHLFYVIRDGDNYTVESAWNQPVISVIVRGGSDELTQQIG